MKLKGLVLSITTMSIFAIVVPATSANAQSWQEKYHNSNKYRVRVLKTTTVNKIKIGKYEYQNKSVGTYKLHKGTVISTNYYGRNGYDWFIYGSKKFKNSKKYTYTASFKKRAFKVLSVKVVKSTYM